VDLSIHRGAAGILAVTPTIGSGYWKSLPNRISDRRALSVFRTPRTIYPSANPAGPTPAWLALLMGGICVGAALLSLSRVRRQRHTSGGRPPRAAVVTRLRRWRTQHGTQNVVYYEFALPEAASARAVATSKAIHAERLGDLHSVRPDNPAAALPIRCAR